MNSFEDVYNKYFPRVYSFIFNLCRDSSLSEEITQEAFYRAYVSFDKYNGSCDIFTWLAAIAKNTYFNYLRKNKIKLVELEEADGQSTESPEDAVFRAFESRQVQLAINKLPKKYRDVVFLRIYAELPYSEIASYLGICQSSAKVIFHRAKEMLRKELTV